MKTAGALIMFLISWVSQCFLFLQFIALGTKYFTKHPHSVCNFNISGRFSAFLLLYYDINAQHMYETKFHEPHTWQLQSGLLCIFPSDMWYLAYGNRCLMTESFVWHFCTFIVTTGGSAALLWPLSCVFLSRLLLCFAKRLCFSLRLRGKSALCRSADKSFLLVTHCLTHKHTNFLNPQVELFRNRWVVSLQTATQQNRSQSSVKEPLETFNVMLVRTPALPQGNSRTFSRYSNLCFPVRSDTCFYFFIFHKRIR